MPFFHPILEYVDYRLKAVNAHALHPSFVYDLYTKVIKPKKVAGVNEHHLLEARKALRHHTGEISIKDYGAGSKVSKDRKRSVKDIAASATSSVHFSGLLRRISAHFKPKHIVELGTSFGLNTMYLSSSKIADVTTFEGCPDTCKLAKQHFERYGYQHIRLVEGNINTTFPTYIEDCKPLDLVYIDANHQYEPTIRYFHLCLLKSHENTILIFDDIHWSAGMKKAWEEIIAHPSVTLSLDLYDAGIVFFKSGLSKQHFILKF